ncbi:MAG: aspartate-semialdehyde dehydrogenase [Acidimicrobiia bacterium]|nr:aspartate-semialdehyde dehydrogenase [Acidimicrobiia bacterium]
MSDLTVAVVGATGAVGRVMRDILAERSFPVGELRLMASERSAGTVLSTGFGGIEVEDLATADPTGVDIALFSAGGDRSREYAPKFAEAGAIVVDNSSAFRMDPEVPLVVADVNNEDAFKHNGIIANPNCTTMVLMMAVAPLHRAAGLEGMVAMSYQSVSGTGNSAITELREQVDWFAKTPRALIDGGWEEPHHTVFTRPIGWNVLAFAGNEVENGYTDEEMKLQNESRKILDVPNLIVEPTCVRVPTVVGHGIAASLWFRDPVTPEQAAKLIDEAPGVQVWADKTATPLDSAGIDDVLVSRIRPTLGESGGISLWAVGDNLRKGAALNTIQIAELFL